MNTEKITLLLRTGKIEDVCLACFAMKDWPLEEVLKVFDISSDERDPRIGSEQISLMRIIISYSHDPFLLVKEAEWAILNNRTHLYLMKPLPAIKAWADECRVIKRLIYINKEKYE